MTPRASERALTATHRLQLNAAFTLHDARDLASPGRCQRDVAPPVDEVGATGMWNALGRLLVHLSVPGGPDIYRGDELWFQALIDPDNRRVVDWIARGARLARCGRRGRTPTGSSPFGAARARRHASFSWHG